VLSGWFHTKELDEFADAMVGRLIESYPPSGEQLSGKKAFQRLRKLFGATFDRIDAFVRAQPLNVYKKARFANRVRWAMLDAGYPREFVDTMTQELVTHLTQAAGKTK